MAALRAGDERAWAAFFARFDPDIRAVAAWPKWRFDPHTREDVVQNIRGSVVRAIATLQSEQSLQAFVRRICVNRCIDTLRRRLREQDRLVPLGHWSEDGDWQETDAPAGDGFDPALALERLERAATLRTALEQLEVGCRGVILQFYVEHRSYREMAAQQGVAVNTVGTRLSRCLEKLRVRLTARQNRE